MAKKQSTPSLPPKVLTSYQRSIVTAPWYFTTEGGTRRATIETLVKSRRIGGSVAGAFRAALWAMGLELHSDGTATVCAPFDVIVVSKDFVGSKRLLREVADACEQLSELGPGYGAFVSATEIRLENGKRISAVPCSDKAIRGATAAFVADEFAFWRQPEACWAALKSVSDPTLGCEAGRPGLIVTTPWDAGSLAHRIMTEWPFPHHSVDIYQAKSAGFPVDIERTFAELGIPELIDTEYKCIWSRGGDSFFPANKLRDCQELALPPDWRGLPAFFGIDVGGGRGRDLTAVTQIRRAGDVAWTVGIRAWNTLDIEEQADAIALWIESSTTAATRGAVPIDRGIMGGDLVDLLRKRLNKRPHLSVVGVGMMPQDQERYAVLARRALEHDRIRIYTGDEAGGDPEFDRTLMLELSQLKSKPGIGGHLTFVTPRDPQKGHLDRAWAWLIGMGKAVTAEPVHAIQSRVDAPWGVHDAIHGPIHSDVRLPDNEPIFGGI